MKKLILAAALLLSACSSKIQHGLAERDAIEVQAVLEDHGISATPVSEGKENKFAIEVPQASASEAIRILRDNHLPKQQPAGFSEVFQGGSVVPTQTEERAMFIRALSGENARMLEAMEGVIEAKAIVVPESKSSAFGQAEPARASVFIKVDAAKAAELQARKAELQQLISGSVPGLQPANVAILFDAVNVAPRPKIVEHKDRTAAVAVGSVAGLLLAVLAGAVVFLTLRARKLRLELDEKSDEDVEEPAAAKPAPNAKKAA